MAGFFGLFDYNKVGPGVDKNAPKKRGFVVFFEIYFRKFWKLIEASLLAALLSVPVLTSGLANAGLTFIGRNFARQKHAFIWSDFWDTVKKNWKQALPVGIINTVLQLIMAYALYFYFPRAAEGQELTIWQYIPFSLMVLINVLFIFMQYYQYMLLITFKFSLRQLYRNSFIFAMAGIKQNLLIALSMLLVYGLLFLIAMIGQIGIVIAVFLLITVVPGFRTLLIQYTIFPLIQKHIIDPYYAEHPHEDMQQRHDLALDPSEEEKAAQEIDENEVIFKDMGRTVQEEPEKEDSSKRKIPKQYSEDQLRRGKRITRQPQDDDDDTI